VGAVRPIALAALLCSSIGCGNKGTVTFSVHAPALKLLDPLADPRISEFLVKASDGSLVGAANESVGMSDLPLGPLLAHDQPIDITMDVLAGTELVGVARVRDVQIQPGVQTSYTAELRKPFAFVGSRLPDESLAMNRLRATQLLDPATAADVAPQLQSSSAPATLPLGVAAAQASSDGRWLLAATIPPTGQPQLTTVDTATGQTLGQVPLTFTPARVVVAPRDVALALVADGAPMGNGIIDVYGDVASFVGGAQMATRILVNAGAVRQAVFSSDGTQLYVLTGDPHALDPCGKPPTAPNQVLVYDVGGSLAQRWSLPAWAADLAVDDLSGQVVVSLPTANQVAVLQVGADGGSVTPRPIITDAVCPTGLDVNNGLVYAITATPDVTQAGDPAFQLRRIGLDGSAATSIPFPQPVYQAKVNESDPKDGKISFDLKVKPKFFDGYEIAVAPDGSRVQFATRAHFVETPDQIFDLIQGFVCQPSLDVVEYGFFSLDTRNQTSSYVSRSQIVTSPASSSTPCIACTNGIFEVDFGCPSVSGDRPAGLATLFGQP
jgi:hypothetical protein